MQRTPWITASAGLLLASTAHADCAESLNNAEVTFDAATYCEAVTEKMGSIGEAKTLKVSNSWPRFFPEVGDECAVEATFTTTLSAFAEKSCSGLKEHPKYQANKTKKVSIALNTHQTGRTFQDRSYVFSVAPKPGAGANKAQLKRGK